ncbi:ALP1-like protein isoform X1 [Tanacetum coccineum]|uniref:ALP1-like protein isoform X1 n=1 Tax=Tanacetum coccineum TaxID=301880 RepID=A0ABQ4YY43_9ASTR
MANDPLYIVSSDNPGMMLTNTPFNGGKFLGWIRTIKMVLGAKFNLGFVDGSSPKPAVIDKRIGYPDWYKGKKGKLLNTQHLIAIFFPTWLVFQDPSTRQVLAASEGFHNLYIYKPSSPKPTHNSFLVLSSFVNKVVHYKFNDVTVDLFHSRLQHTYVSKLIHVHDYLRKPTMTDVLKLYRHHEEKHEFLGMLGSLYCTDWEWFGCPYGFKAQYVRHDHGSNPFILLEAVASQDLWIWHAFFPNGVTYPWGYYLVDGIYPELLTFAKTIPEPSDDDHKRILYKQKQEAARRFGTSEDKGKAISPDWYPEEAHQPEDPERSDEQRRAIMRHIRSAQAHQNLRADLIEHLSRNA